MGLDLPRFYAACNPSKPLAMGNADERQYYIDFASVRGGKIIEALSRTIAVLAPDQPTCQLFTGHIGCGKSTELLRLKAELEERGFHVIYFESSQDLDMADVDVTDILLAIARQVSENLEMMKINLQPRGFKRILKEAADFLQTPIELSGSIEVPGVGEITASNDELGFSLPGGIATITAKTQQSPTLRQRLRNWLEPRTNPILQAINQEIFDRATRELQNLGKKGLVVIVDNLDRVHNKRTSSGSLLPEYLFIDRGQQLRQLNCHVVYSIPLSLVFSNDSERLKNRLGGGIPPKVLPMVPVQMRDGSECLAGMNLLRQMVMTRAFPQVDTSERQGLIAEVFDSRETLDRLCRISGGHVRNLLGLLYSCLQQADPPFDRESLETVIREHRDYLISSIADDEWELLKKLVTRQNVSGDEEYQTLLRSMFVYEYRDREGSWFWINPALAEAKNFQQWLNANSRRITQSIISTR
ncbi:MAG: ATP-binding protein [Hormoscilla sp.]